MNENLAPRRVASVDALRGFAALGVATFHLYTQNLSPEWLSTVPSDVNRLLVWGRWGVQLFFVISGFVIMHSLYSRVNFDRFVDLPLYFARRIVRLDVLYILVLAVWVSLRIALPPLSSDVMPRIEYDPTTILKNIFYFLPINRGLWLPVAWTLAIEVQFYMLMASLFITVNMMKRPPSVSGYLLATIAIASLVYPAKIVDLSIGFWLFPSLFNLLAGSLIYLMLFQRQWIFKATNILFITLLMIIYYHGRESHVLATIFSYMFLLFAILLLPERIVSCRLATVLGAISYGMYLIHQPIGYFFVTPLVNSKIPIVSTNPVALFIGLLATVAVSYGLYVLVERPSINLSRHIRRNGC